MASHLDDVTETKAICRDGTEAEQAERGVSAIRGTDRRRPQLAVPRVSEQFWNPRNELLGILRVARLAVRGRGRRVSPSDRLFLLLREAVHGVEQSVLPEPLGAGFRELGVSLARSPQGSDLFPRRRVRVESLDEGEGPVLKQRRRVQTCVALRVETSKRTLESQTE